MKNQQTQGVMYGSKIEAKILLFYMMTLHMENSLRAVRKHYNN